MVPSSPGLYVLILKLPEPATIVVGRLGSFFFPAGWYAYVGSARGPGGMRARIRRHIRLDKPLHWHIDHLRRCAKPETVWFSSEDGFNECGWADGLTKLGGSSIPVPGFGSSDCGCRAHLIRFASSPEAADFAAVVGQDVYSELLDTSAG